MDERGEGSHEEGRAFEPAGGTSNGAAGGEARSLALERHLRLARRFFEQAPPFRAQFERDGTVSLQLKHYQYWPNRPAVDATVWRPISIHQSLEQAERHLRHMTSPHVYYDERGRLARTPAPTDEELATPANPWRP